LSPGPDPREPVGILGGTFDPVHEGHLAIAEQARQTLGLARCLLLPAALPPHKSREELSPASHREAMLRLAMSGRVGIEIHTLELRPERVCYTVDSLRRLREGAPPLDPVFILGMDALGTITEWKHWRDLITEFDLAVIDRAARRSELHPEVAARLVAAPSPGKPPGGPAIGSGGRIFRLPTHPIPVSSSSIRELARAGADLSGLVPPAVARYIQDMGLYKEEGDR
jgi:nicotinate-nucleotide adenylyltransferase